MAWIAFVFTNIMFGLILTVLVRSRLNQMIEGSRHNLSSKRDELSIKIGIESSLSGNLGKLVELDALAEKIIEYRSYNARLRAIRGRLIISKAELEALETRLTELNERRGSREQGEGRIEHIVELETSNELAKHLDHLTSRLVEIARNKDILKELANRIGEEAIIEKVTRQLEHLQVWLIEIRR